jgi:serine/threonine protein kinase
MTTIAHESPVESTTGIRGMRGTIRWMAPELMYPEKFGFSDQYGERLPSRSTDTYALGMTILEVSTF